MAIERIDVITNYNCNNNCLFCVMDMPIKRWGKRPNKTIKKEILEGRKKYRCDSLVLTGGESTMRQDILEIVKYAKSVGFKTIQLQTNGRMLRYKKLCCGLINAGINSFTVSFHAHNSKLGDSLSQTEGSFNQTLEGMRNIKHFGARLITNTVVCSRNYMYIPEIIKLAVSMKADQIQLVFVRPVGMAFSNYNNTVPKMSKTIPFIEKGIELCKSNSIFCVVEGIPYCLLQGYKEHIAERYMPNVFIKADEKYLKRRRKVKRKLKCRECRICKKNEECTGVWKEYLNKEGCGEFKPISERKI